MVSFFLYHDPLASAAMLIRVLLSLLPALLAAGQAVAGVVVLTSKAPYWQVGVRDEDLSRACSLNTFGPKYPGDFVARFIGPVGGGMLDVAKGTGVNLRDPKRLAKRNEDYFFRNVGTTSCEVLVSGRKGAKSAG
jgi:hypothetical protein